MLLNNAQAIACRDAMMALNNVNGYIQVAFVDEVAGMVICLDHHREGHIEIKQYRLKMEPTCIKSEWYKGQQSFFNLYDINV